jgi:hypothetical protein
MIMRQTIYDSAIIVLGTIQAIPCMMMFSDNLFAVVLGILYSVCLAYFWSSTIIGKRFFRELWRSTLRLENLLHPDLK